MKATLQHMCGAFILCRIASRWVCMLGLDLQQVFASILSGIFLSWFCSDLGIVRHHFDCHRRNRWFCPQQWH